jgi:hypothetical protein
MHSTWESTKYNMIKTVLLAPFSIVYLRLEEPSPLTDHGIKMNEI